MHSLEKLVRKNSIAWHMRSYLSRNRGIRWRSWLRHCAVSRVVAGSIPTVSLEFFINVIFPAALWPCSRLSLQHKWVPGIFTRVKGGRCLWLTTLPPSCANCLEIWKPQPPGTLWNWTVAYLCKHALFYCFVVIIFLVCIAICLL